MTTLIIEQMLRGFSSGRLYEPGTRAPSDQSPAGSEGGEDNGPGGYNGQGRPAAVGRAGSFNPEEQRLSESRSHGTPVAEFSPSR